MKVLLADDDRTRCDLVAGLLKQAKLSLDTVHDGEAAIATTGRREYDVVVLEATMGKASGFDVLERIRIGSDVPVIMLTPPGDTPARVKGLNLGADDCVARPPDPDELLGRILAIVRRTNKAHSSQTIEIDDLVYHTSRNEVVIAGATIALTGVESVILRMLLSRAGEPVSREHIYRTVLNREPSPYDRSLDTHISNLRKKLGKADGGGKRILSVRGLGYQYVR